MVIIGCWDSHQFDKGTMFSIEGYDYALDGDAMLREDAVYKCKLAALKRGKINFTRNLLFTTHSFLPPP